jgi:type I restriction enzyme, R subunit
MNEAETRAEYIDPRLKASGWGEVEGSKVLREYRITEGRILVGGTRAKPDIADYILVYKNQKLAVIEAKPDEQSESEGVGQAKEYAHKMQIEYTYATNGKRIYQISMKSGKEEYVDAFPTPDDIWNKVFSDQNEWKEKFASVPLEGELGKRYYQESAVNKAINVIAEDKKRILLTLATGTGKTAIAFQIIWKLYQTRWTLQRDGNRRPRILFLADRNILADQAFNTFGAFPEDALVRINTLDIRKKGKVPMNGSVFFTIFQTFMSGPQGTPYFGDYPSDFFDLIVVDECHRGGANDEGNWRGILEYFSPAVQLGLTATPKRKDNVDTYRYFGDPVYIYSLKEGVNDGFLTPFKVKRIQTTLDEYVYTSDDQIVEGEVEEGKIYKEPDFNKIIEIKEREAKRVQLLLENINQNEKTIVFCATQDHALAVRDLINQFKKSKDPFYCVRVTANDGARGDQYLRDFQDNEKTIPTILTTSQKLSTGVDARNIRNIVLMRPINNMIEFKQIIGRGTRLFDGKEYFTILDFVDAYKLFLDPEWDGEPILEICSKCGQNPCICEKKPVEPCPICGQRPCICPKPPPEPCPVCGKIPCECESKKKIKIKLRDGKEREIQHMISTSYWGADGKPMSSEEFIQSLYGVLPELFKDEEELRIIWSSPITRKRFLERLFNIGIDIEQIENITKIVNAEHCDFYDVLLFLAFNNPLITRKQRVEGNKDHIFEHLTDKQEEFLQFVLQKYEETGFEELDEEKLPILLNLKYHAIADAEEVLGDVEGIRATFIDLQKNLYNKIEVK